MIRRKTLHRPPVYDADTVVRASAHHLYTQLDALFLEDEWAEWAAPLEVPFSTETGRPIDPVVYLWPPQDLWRDAARELPGP